MKKYLLITGLLLSTVFASCSDSSDSDCGEAYLILVNKTTFSIGITVNGSYRTLSPNQEYKQFVTPNTSVSYTGLAGKHSWGKTFTLEDCETKRVSLTVSS